MTNLKDQILEIANRHLSDESHFLVDVIISSKKGPNKVLILLDGDEGVNIDDCADLSRAVSNEIEESNLISDAYRIEVSSPGVDFPLSMDRQFQKNIGRTVKVSLDDGKDVKGELKAYDDKSLTLEVTKGKGKKKEVEEVTLPLLNIKKTIVQISFK
ncbi:ribosome maturation factor RimP [Fulvivirga sp. RKSG066]|nr:ribosome maturation factor RimP [Fulvivirga aurantia]